MLLQLTLSIQKDLHCGTDYMKGGCFDWVPQYSCIIKWKIVILMRVLATDQHELAWGRRRRRRGRFKRLSIRCKEKDENGYK